MKKKSFFLLLPILLFGCKSFFINEALTQIGAYDEFVKIESFKYNDKDIVFIPMVHLATQNFYDDTSKKIDSLKKKGFFFYYELVKNEGKRSDTLLYKVRKLMGMSMPVGGYGEKLKKLEKYKLKKKLVIQPKYKQLGITEENAKNVDLSLTTIVKAYEKKHGEVLLDSCDFASKPLEKYKCESKPNRQFMNEFALDLRNKNIVSTLDKDTLHNKIAIIYGKGHVKGIKEMIFPKDTLN